MEERDKCPGRSYNSIDGKWYWEYAYRYEQPMRHLISRFLSFQKPPFTKIARRCFGRLLMSSFSKMLCNFFEVPNSLMLNGWSILCFQPSETFFMLTFLPVKRGEIPVKTKEKRTDKTLSTNQVKMDCNLTGTAN